MKKLMTIAITALLGVGLIFAQATGGSPGKQKESGKKATKTKKGHKGGSTTNGSTDPTPK